MSVLIKVYDNQDYLGNIMVPLNMTYDRVIYLYRHIDKKRKAEALKNILDKHHISTEFIKVEDDNVIDELLSNYNNADIDITAVRYLSIYLFERVLKLNSNIYYYDREENVIKDYRRHITVKSELKHLSIKEMVNLSGATLMSSMHLLPDMNNKEITKTVLMIVDEAIDNYHGFTNFISLMMQIIARGTLRLSDNDIKHIINNPVYHIMHKHGVLEVRDDELYIVNDYYKELLKNAGAWLETYLYIKVMESGQFDDCTMSSVIEFKDSDVRVPISCEIDVIVMKDNHLGLVSCKSNKVDTDAINEIKVHNTVFGNHLSKAVIFTAEDMNIKNPAIFKKAQELDVRVIDITAIKNHAVPLVMNKIFNDTYEYERVRE